MAEITREQIKSVLAHYEYEPHSAFVEGLEVQDLRALCDLALQALRQREGVWVPREPTEAMVEAGCDAMQGNWGAQDVYKAMLAASEQDQRGAGATTVSEGKPASYRAVAGLTGTEPVQPPPLHSAPHQTAAVQERLVGVVPQSVPAMEGAEHEPPSPASAAALESARLEGIRLGAEEARERVRAKYPDAVVESTTATVYRVYTADGRKIFGSGPNEDAAWIDAAGRV